MGSKFTEITTKYARGTTRNAGACFQCSDGCGSVMSGFTHLRDTMRGIYGQNQRESYPCALWCHDALSCNIDMGVFHSVPFPHLLTSAVAVLCFPLCLTIGGLRNHVVGETCVGRSGDTCCPACITALFVSIACKQSLPAFLASPPLFTPCRISVALRLLQCIHCRSKASSRSES